MFNPKHLNIITILHKLFFRYRLLISVRYFSKCFHPHYLPDITPRVTSEKFIRKAIGLSSWWRHQMETFSALLAICAGNSPVTSEFPAQRPVTRSFAIFLDLLLNKRLSKQSWGWWFATPSRQLWRHWKAIPHVWWSLNDMHGFTNWNSVDDLFFSYWTLICQCKYTVSHYLFNCWCRSCMSSKINGWLISTSSGLCVGSFAQIEYQIKPSNQTNQSYNYNYFALVVFQISSFDISQIFFKCFHPHYLPDITPRFAYEKFIRKAIGLSSWWRHQMETLSALLAICAGNSPVTSEFPAQRPVTRSFAIFLDLLLNKRLSKQSWGWWFETPSHPLWRHWRAIPHGWWSLNDMHDFTNWNSVDDRFFRIEHWYVNQNIRYGIFYLTTDVGAVCRRKSMVGSYLFHRGCKWVHLHRLNIRLSLQTTQTNHTTQRSCLSIGYSDMLLKSYT